MKKLFFLLLLTATILLQYCSSSKKAQAATSPKITYEGNIQPLIAENCSPCHIPPRGMKKPFDTYEAAKENIDSMISRIQRNPGDHGFMPFKRNKLPDSTILAFIKWRNDGLLQK